ncbi:Endoglucanase 7 [Camellia lanceoleosa]|uniref:Endoglucanase 7 n=1 Tax=Camellia lanceoleosa TaxID=1840588 RepID=A0ACC0HMW3_9ERIC|nr:Endoglucanase 7 [Camellia lanceoleosa]
MYSSNHWEGTLEISNGTGESMTEDVERSRETNMAEWDRASIAHQQQQQQYHHHHHLDETQQSWLLGPDDLNKKKNKYVDLGCVVCSRKALRWTLWSVMIAFFVIALPIIIAKYLPKHKPRPSPPDNYTLASTKPSSSSTPKNVRSPLSLSHLHVFFIS